jgi:hypothetical protein
MVVPLPLQTVKTVGLAVPPTDIGSTVTSAGLERTTPHNPLCTTTRNAVATDSGPVVKGLSVETISFVVVQLSVEDCHSTIVPVWPLKVMLVPLPLQTADNTGLAVPPMAPGSTVTFTVPMAGL